jgi:hypothetical protein
MAYVLSPHSVRVTADDLSLYSTCSYSFLVVVDNFLT